MPVVDRDIERQIVIQGRAQGKSDEEIKKFVTIFREQTLKKQESQKKPSFASQIASGTGGLIKEQAGAVKGAVGEAFEKGRAQSPLQQLLGPARAFKGAVTGLSTSAGERLADVVDAGIESVKAAPEVIRRGGAVTGQLLRGGELSDPLETPTRFVPESQRITPEGLEGIRGATDIQRKAVTGVAEFIPTPGAQFAAGLAGGQKKAVEEGAEPVEALTRGLVTGGERAALIGLLRKAKFKKKQEVKDVSIETIKPDIRTRATLTDRQITATARQAKIDPVRGEKLIRAANKAAGDDLAIKPVEITGQKLNSFIEELKAINSAAGKKIGIFANKLGGVKSSVNTKGMLKSFSKDLTNANVVVRNGILDFAKSDLKGLPVTSKKLLQEQFNLLRGGGVNPRELLANQRDLGRRLFAGSKDAQFTGAEKIINNIRDMSTSQLKKQFPQIADDFAKFSKTADAIDNVKGMVGAGGEKSPQILRRLFGNARGQSIGTLKDLEKLAKDLGIKSGQNIAKEANFSVIAEEVAGVKPPTSLAGQISGEIAIPTKGNVLSKLAEGGAKRLLGSSEENLMRLLKSQSLQPKISLGTILDEIF